MFLELLYAFWIFKGITNIYSAVYIHNERSIQSNIFCTQILCAKSINEFLQTNCIAWGFDITNLNNKQLLFSQVTIILPNE